MYLSREELMKKLEASLGEQEADVGKKHDGGKNRLDLIPVSTIIALGKVLTHGAGKYGDRNWEKGLDWNRPYGAALRHLTAWWDGEDLDKESGMSHLWHAACEISFLIEYEANQTGKDNRPKHDSTTGTNGGNWDPHTRTPWGV